MSKLAFVVAWMVPVWAMAQEVVAPVTEVVAPVVEPVASFPWADNAMVVLIVTTALGIISKLVHMIPGKAGDIVGWLVDLFSANVAHKK